MLSNFTLIPKLIYDLGSLGDFLNLSKLSFSHVKEEDNIDLAWLLKVLETMYINTIGTQDIVARDKKKKTAAIIH